MIRIEVSPVPLRPKAWLVWFWFALLLATPTIPWSDFVGHPHWDNIRWSPFLDFSLTPRMLLDVVGNFAWFFCIGYLFMYRRDDRSTAPLKPVILAAAIASFTLEGYQVFCHNRIPSATDVVCNVVGATIGAWLAKRHQPTPIQPVRTLVLVDND